MDQQDIETIQSSMIEPAVDVFEAATHAREEKREKIIKIIIGTVIIILLAQCLCYLYVKTRFKDQNQSHTDSLDENKSSKFGGIGSSPSLTNTHTFRRRNSFGLTTINEADEQHSYMDSNN